MSEESKTVSGENASSSDEFNRTIVIQNPEHRKGRESAPRHKFAKSLFRKKAEVSDLIGNMDMSHYTDVELDTSPNLTRPLSTLDSRYSVMEEFAKGGQATVSVARDKNLRRVVAIKSLKKASGEKSDQFDSFVAEAKVTAQLDHPSIIPIYGLTGDEEHGVHLSMKLVNGKTLRDYLRNLVLNYRVRGIKSFDEAVELRKRLELFLRVCDAIAYAHHRNIMHRDLKPENIMIGEFMEVFVMDWGLARAIPKEGEAPSEKEKLAGTPRYFSPEALRGDRCDARADIFTLGLILQEVVTLRFAVRGRDEKEYMERIVNGELEPVEHVFGYKIDKTLKAIIRKATAYQVEERYQSVEELGEDLRRYMGGLETSALPEDFFTRSMRTLHRHRRGFLISIFALLAGFSFITAYTVYRQMEMTMEMNEVERETEQKATIAKQESNRQMALQRQALNYLYNRTAATARHLDITGLNIEEQVSALARIAAYLLSYNTGNEEKDSSTAFHPSMDKMEKMERGMFYSPYYKRMVALDYGIRTMAPTADVEACRLFARKVAPALTKMKNIVLGCQSGFHFDKKDYGKLKFDYMHNGSPIRAVYLGSKGGIKLLYPWRGNYSRNIDPRQRAWYKDALGKEDPVWGKPYMDVDSVSGLSIPCSVQIVDLQGNFRGVAGLDVSVNRLTSGVLRQGNVGDYVIEKAVINREGHVIFSSKSPFFNKKFDPEKFHQDTAFETPLFGSQEVRDRILKQGEYGTFFVKENGKDIVYSYAFLEIFDMFYVVSADYRKLLEHMKNEHHQEATALSRHHHSLPQAPAAAPQAPAPQAPAPQK